MQDMLDYLLDMLDIKGLAAANIWQARTQQASTGLLDTFWHACSC